MTSIKSQALKDTDFSNAFVNKRYVSYFWIVSWLHIFQANTWRTYLREIYVERFYHALTVTKGKEDSYPWAADGDGVVDVAHRGSHRANKAHAAVHGVMRRDAPEAPLRYSPPGSAGPQPS